MRKITELKHLKYRTVRSKDASGNRVSKKEQYMGYRQVTTVSGGKRFAHYFIDVIIYYLIYYVVLFIAEAVAGGMVEPLTSAIFTFYLTVLFMFLFPLYYIFFEGWLQRTPGKFLTKSIVIDIYGNKPDLGTNILRNIIRLVPFEKISCMNDRGWHDRWSDTFVVTQEEYDKIQELLKQEMDQALSHQV